MKRWIARVMGLAVSLSVLGMAMPVHAGAGHTPGAFAVGPSRDATYNTSHLGTARL